MTPGDTPGQDNDPKAVALMQRVLDRLTFAVWKNCPKRIRENATNPLRIFTKEGPRVFHHDDALDETINTLSRSIHDMGVTDYLRIVTRARFADSRTIEGQYRCWFLRDLQDVYPSFDAHMVLEHDGDRFRMREVRNHIERDRWPLLTSVAMPTGTAGKPADHVFDYAEFNAFLDDISEPFSTRDIARWRKRMMLPFSMVTAQGPVTLRTDAEMQENFDLYLKAVDAMNLDTIARTPIRFENCYDDTVIATYRTELLSKGKRQADRYTSSALLQQTPDGWKMSSIMNARGHHQWTGRPPLPNGEQK